MAHCPIGSLSIWSVTWLALSLSGWSPDFNDPITQMLLLEKTTWREMYFSMVRISLTTWQQDNNQTNPGRHNWSGTGENTSTGNKKAGRGTDGWMLSVWPGAGGCQGQVTDSLFKGRLMCDDQSERRYIVKEWICLLSVFVLKDAIRWLPPPSWCSWIFRPTCLAIKKCVCVTENQKISTFLKKMYSSLIMRYIRDTSRHVWFSVKLFL